MTKLRSKFSYFLKEELIVPIVVVLAVFLAFLPFLYEETSIHNNLIETRYPLIETEFPPDMRVYLSRMREGYEGQWLVMEKYTSEVHKPSVLHIGYLLMGKITGVIGLDPVTAFPIWRLICGVFLLFSGYFFISEFLKEKKLRITAFLLFVFVGNLPISTKDGVSLFGQSFSLNLGWFTFFDPVKRLVYLPHYSLSAGLLALAMVYLWRGVNHLKRSDFIKAGILGFLATIILPQCLMVIILVTMLLIPYLFVQKTDWLKLLKNVWPFVLFGGLSLILIGFSLSYFPWNVQSQADLTKRYMGFDVIGVLLGLGISAVLSLVGIVWIVVRRLKTGYISVAWVLCTVILVVLFTIFPYSNSYRPLQIDLHLPLAVVSVVLLNDIVERYFNKRKLAIYLFLITLMILPSFLIWSISLKGQINFIDAKIAAGYPLIPQLPYVVYPVKPAMDAIDWLRNNTDHDQVVLAAETIGSMVPAYAGNTVYLGHGHQTVAFEDKMILMKSFYQGSMDDIRAANFIKKGRINYVFYGPEEAEISGGSHPKYIFLKEVFGNNLIRIYKVDEKI